MKRAPGAAAEWSITAHRSHDYRALISRWRAVAAAAGLRLKKFAEEGGYPLYVLRSRLPLDSGALYISAGIHGDEPGGTEAFIQWAEMNARRLAKIPCIFFPCLNPWGLVNNVRFDAERRDLNRAFHSNVPGFVGVLKEMLRGCRFALAMTLHEDFDGQGLYIYEVTNAVDGWGEQLLEVARPIIPIEGRLTIEGRRAKSGLVRRRVGAALLKRFEIIGFPEAVYLHLHHAERTYTVETPSEFALDQRVAAQRAILEECVRRVFPRT